MWKGFGILMAFCAVLCSAQAAVLRPEEQPETTTVLSVDSTTVESKAESTPTLNKVSLSRDEEASIQIGLVTVDPAPGTIAGDQNVDLAKSQMKSAKLLLLSTPAQRPAQVEQQLDEQDESEIASAGSAEAGLPTTEVTTLQAQEESTTIGSIEAEATTTESSDRKTTKLFAINATISAQDSPVPNLAIAVATDNATVSFAEQPQAAGDNNVAIKLALVEPEADYVLLDDDVQLAAHATHDELQLGSFTHIDSDVHLQPAVHSVEIVPTSFNDPLIINYVHNLR